MVSVIIPTFNRDSLLPRSIKSVLAQTHGDFELIVVDDGSTDETEEVVNDFTRRDHRIKYVRQTHSGSPPKVRNTGIKEARGEYIAFLDSDDEWLPNKLESQLNALARNPEKADFVTCDSIIRSSKGDAVYRNPEWENHAEQILWGPFISIGSTLLIKTSVIKEFGGFDESLGLVEDWDLPLRLLIAGCGVSMVHEPLAICYSHETNITRIDLNSTAPFVSRKRYLELFLEKHRELFRRNKKPFSFHLSRLGAFAFLSGEKRKAVHYLIESVKMNPLHLRPYALIVISFLGERAFRMILSFVRNVKPDLLSKMLKYY